jgi:hypothetical protein
MVSAFAMTSAASAQIITQAGNSPVYMINFDGIQGVINTNPKNPHEVTHLAPGELIPGSLTGPENFNSNNPNDFGIHPTQ